MLSNINSNHKRFNTVEKYFPIRQNYLIDRLNFDCGPIYTFFFNFFIYIGAQLLYTAVLVPTGQQSESAICIHISPLFWTSVPFRSPQRTG